MLTNIDLADKEFYLANEGKTLDFGYFLAKTGVNNLVICLEGDLGCGKTTFVRGFLRGLGYLGKVKSPTYNILEEYNISGIKIYHFDLYRFKNPQEWVDCGFQDIREGIIFIEWASLALDYLPSIDLTIQFSMVDYGRLCKIIPITLNGSNFYKQWEILLEEI